MKKTSKERSENDTKLMKEIENKMISQVIVHLQTSLFIGENEDRLLAFESIANLASKDSDQDLKLDVSEVVMASEKAKKKVVSTPVESQRRKRRSAVKEVQEVEPKTPEEAERTLLIYSNMIEASDYSSSSMVLKEDFLEIVDELLKSMCKSLVVGEDPAVAESEIAVLRSDMNNFQEADANISYIACLNCTMAITTSARVRLGPEVKEKFSDWQCSDSQTCNGACVGSAQFPDDHLLAEQNSSRNSDVVLVKLFNPETSYEIEFTGLSHPVSLELTLKNSTLLNSSSPKCLKWDKELSSWSNDSVTTGSLEKTGDEYHVGCTSTKLGFFAVFMVEPQDDVYTTSSSPSSPTSQMLNPETEQLITREPQTSLAAQVEFFFKVDLRSHLPNNTARNKFKSKIIEKLVERLEIKPSRISNMFIREGSIIVSFVLLPGEYGDKSVTQALNSLQTIVEDSMFSVVLDDGKILTADANSFLFKYTSNYNEWPTVQTTSSGFDATTKSIVSKAKSGLINSGVVAAIIASVVVTVFAGMTFCYVWKRKKHKKILPYEKSVWSEMRDTRDDTTTSKVSRHDQRTPDYVSSTDVTILPGTPNYKEK